MDLGKEYKRMADEGFFRGLSVLAHADQIGDLIKATGAKTLLDWGCGAGDQYRKPHNLHKRWKVPQPQLFDPAFKKHSGKPRGMFDGVICTDMLEHIREGAVDETIANLFKHADKFVFATVCCRPAKKTFSNGRNLHITVKPLEWWYEGFKANATKDVKWQLVETP